MNLEDFLMKDKEKADDFLQEIRTYIFLKASSKEIGYHPKTPTHYRELIQRKYEITELIFEQACDFLTDNKQVLPLKYR